MMILKLIFQVFVLYQITQIISQSTLTRPIRDYLRYLGLKYNAISWIHGLISCFLCTSVWVGFVLTYFLEDFANDLGYSSVSWFWNGIFTSSLAWFLYVWEESKLNKS